MLSEFKQDVRTKNSEKVERLTMRSIKISEKVALPSKRSSKNFGEICAPHQTLEQKIWRKLRGPPNTRTKFSEKVARPTKLSNKNFGEICAPRHTERFCRFSTPPPSATAAPSTSSCRSGSKQDLSGK
jgi:hypothetical protein